MDGVIRILMHNAGTIGVALILLLCVVAAVWGIIKNRQNGGSTCMGNCNSCSQLGLCKTKTKESKK